MTGWRPTNVPRRLRWERIAIPAGLMAAMAMVANIAFWSGWRINLTESEPLGWYRLHSMAAGEAIHRGVEIEFCPPAFVTPKAFTFYLAGNCPAGGMPMFKTVVGVPGDYIRVDLQGVWINGRELPHSGQLMRARQNPWLRLPHELGNFTLAAGQYWIYGSGALPDFAGQSFDSRYWGPITTDQIRRVADTHYAPMLAGELDDLQ